MKIKLPYPILFFMMMTIVLPVEAMDPRSSHIQMSKDAASKPEIYNRFMEKKKAPRHKPVLDAKRKKLRRRHGYQPDAPLVDNVMLSEMSYDELRAMCAKIKKDREASTVSYQNSKKTNSVLDVAGKAFSSMAINDLLERELRYLERAKKMCEKPDDLSDILIDMADNNFELGRFKKAEKLYHEFIDLYPGSEQMEYALYKDILCSFYQTLTPDRDQSSTRSTIELTDKFLERADLFGNYKEEVNKIRRQCYTKLADAELNVCGFYLMRDDYTPIERRIESVRNDILPHVPELETRLIAFESNVKEKKVAFEDYVQERRKGMEIAQAKKIQKKQEREKRKQQPVLFAQFDPKAEAPKVAKGKKPKLRLSKDFD